MSAPAGAPSVQRAAVGGRHLEYVDVGTGPVLLLVHGTGGAWSFWRQNIGALAQDFRVIAPSLPGCGESQRLLPPPTDLLPYADALAGLLDHLGVPSATVVGHSLGGLVALRTALTHPSRVHRLVLVDSGGTPLGRVRLAAVTRSLLLVHALCAREGFVHYVLSHPRLRHRIAAGALVNPDLMTEEILAEGLRSFGVPGVADAIRAGTREQGTSSAEWLRVATTVIWGRCDRILPLRLGVQLTGSIRGAELKVIDDAGHAPMLDQPEAFAAAVRQL